MLDKHASLLNAGQTQNDDPVAPPKKKKTQRKPTVKVEAMRQTLGAKRGAKARKVLGGNHRNERDNDDIDEVLPLVTL